MFHTERGLSNVWVDMQKSWSTSGIYHCFGEVGASCRADFGIWSLVLKILGYIYLYFPIHIFLKQISLRSLKSINSTHVAGKSKAVRRRNVVKSSRFRVTDHVAQSNIVFDITTK